MMSPKSTPHLEACDISRSFQIGRNRLTVLQNVSLQIPQGAAVFLCGASGAGKTTLLYTLAGLESPEAGEVFFENQSLYRLSGDRLSALRNRRMGFVFQSYFLLPELTALENVLLPSLISGQKQRERGQALLERVGLAARRDHLPSELSGGEQQRVAIARSLINNPSILFADEPTGNLDSANGAAIMDLLMQLVREDGRTLVVVTHDANLARRGDHLWRVADGRVLPA